MPKNAKTRTDPIGSNHAQNSTATEAAAGRSLYIIEYRI